MDVQGIVRAERAAKKPPPVDGGTAGAEANDGGHFAGIGLPAEAGWYVSAALYWTGGLTILLVERFSGDDVLNPMVGFLATILLACSPMLLLGAHFRPDAAWGPHVRILIPYAVLGAGAFVVGDAIGPLVLLAMLPLFAVAFLHQAKIALPYSVSSIAYMAIVLLVYDGSAASVTRVIVLCGTMSAVVAGLIFSQTRLRRVAARNHDLSVTDPLTGLANLRRLQTRLRQEIQRSARDGSQIVMYAIDLDDFKEVNDHFSYQLGDAVLQSVAKALSSVMQTGDLLVRRGGDEFAVLTLVRSDRDEEEFGTLIGNTIEDARAAICPDVNPCASVTRVHHMPGESAEAFLRRVDEGLHEAKLDAHPDRRLAEETADEPLREDPIFAEGIDERTGERPIVGRAQISSSSVSRRSDLKVAWRLAAAGAGVPALLMATVALVGIAPDLREPVPMACIAGLAIVAGGSLLAARAELPIVWAHVPLTASLLLTTLAIFQADESRYSLLELYAIQTPLAVYLLAWRQAWPYAALSGGFYAYFLLDSDYRFAIFQIAMFIGIMGVLTVLLERGQRMTRRYSEQAAALSVVDPLTGAANLRGFARRVEDEIARCTSLGDSLSLAMIDLEGFKFVNDRYSHTMGDTVLVETAKAIRNVAREDELVVRRGGDEFVVVCVPEAHTDMAAFARRIAASITTTRLELTPDLPAGATVVNVRWRPGEDAQMYMRRADEALHAAKAQERVSSRARARA